MQTFMDQNSVYFDVDYYLTMCHEKVEQISNVFSVYQIDELRHCVGHYLFFATVEFRIYSDKY